MPWYLLVHLDEYSYDVWCWQAKQSPVVSGLSVAIRILFLPPTFHCLHGQETLYHGETDGRINILQQSITECPWNSLGALFKWTCDYRGKKCQCLYRLSAGLFSAEGWWHFSSGLFEQPSPECSQAAQSPHCPPITPSTILFLFPIYSSCVSFIHNWVS